MYGVLYQIKSWQVLKKCPLLPCFRIFQNYHVKIMCITFFYGIKEYFAYFKLTVFSRTTKTSLKNAHTWRSRIT